MNYKMKLEFNKRKVINIIYIFAISIILFSNIFSNSLSKIFKLVPNYDYSNTTEIHILDVGQGDAIIIKFDNGSTMLIDTGTQDCGRKLEYYLDNVILNNSKVIDYFVLTHIDNDHSGNALNILRKYKIGKFFRPSMTSLIEDANSLNSTPYFDKIISEAKSKNILMENNCAGLTLVVGVTKLTWLSPLNLDDNINISSNEYSPIIKLEYRNHSALLTGDVNSDIEREVINYYSNGVLDCDILKLAHHGSKTSTSYEFLQTTSPQYIAVSVGENSYGHPSNDTLNRIYEYSESVEGDLHNKVYSTKECGNIIFKLSYNIDVDFIENIDKYSFTPYYIYTILACVVLLILLIIPYFEVWKKNIRYKKQNKKFKELKKSDINSN